MPRRLLNQHSQSPRSTKNLRPALERIEPRLLPTTFYVSSLADSGMNTLRAAITSSNTTSGANVIDFQTSGTITLLSDLPAILNQVSIDGTTGTGFSGAPVVEVDANGYNAFQFNSGSAGSTLRSLDVVEAGGAGVALGDSNIGLFGNYIGVGLDGATAMPNAGDGVLVNSTSNNNVIGATSTLVPGQTTDAISIASNVISGNRGNGIELDGSTGNSIVANYVGVDVSGTIAVGNLGNGIELDGAVNNTIGGTISFNNASGLVPDTNIISSNRGDGILLENSSTGNTVASNFIGVNVTGNSPLGNTLDGLAITNGSNDNQIIGTYFNLNPFVFANVISGNRGNGISVTNANDTIIHADYLGVGVNNQTAVGNALDGLLVAGTSANTQFGGVIPLGNVSSANGQNGVEIRDSASGTVAFNTFAGVAAFETYTNLGNGANGFLITSTGPGNVIRTNVVAANHGNGIVLGGNATGVQVYNDIVGMNTSGFTPNPNWGNGLVITGNANRNIVGSYTPSVVPQNLFSGNLGNGVVINGGAYDNLIFDSYIGTGDFGSHAAPNGGAGIYVGGSAYGNTIGGGSVLFGNVISGNIGPGVVLTGGSFQTYIFGNDIGTDPSGQIPLPNGGPGVYISNSTNNLIGNFSSSYANVISFNVGGGVVVASGAGNIISQNSIYSNQSAGIILQPGANGNQSAPLLTGVSRGARSTTITGSLTSTPRSHFIIEFFATPKRKSRGGAQGETFLGSRQVRTNKFGFVSFKLKAASPGASMVYTATATSDNDNTSMFSNILKARS